MNVSIEQQLYNNNKKPAIHQGIKLNVLNLSKKIKNFAKAAIQLNIKIIKYIYKINLIAQKN